MTDYTLTAEQQNILNHIVSVDGILLVSAGAGCGKTFMAERVVEALSPKKALYMAFNKAIVEEGVHTFHGTGMECRTLHALAYKYFNRPKGNIEDLTYTCIVENIAYKMKYEILEAINLFFVSASVDMYEYFETYFQGKPKSAELVRLSEKYVEKMLAGEVSPSFNFLLKYFHLMLVEGTVECNYDLVILDEINDTTEVALCIFQLINAPKKLGLGETNQAIYQFMNLANGFEVLKAEPCLTLRNSFRCSKKIAARIQKTMRAELDETFTFSGTDTPVANGKYLYCTATNAAIISEINNRLNEGKGFHLLRRISDIFAAPLALASAGAGKVPFQKKYKFLADEYKNYKENRDKNQTYLAYVLKYVDDDEIQSTCKLLLALKRNGINLFDLYARAKTAKVDLDYVISTAFTAKGLEFETVWIDDGLNDSIFLIRKFGGVQTEEDVVKYRIYYVAASRAGKNLLNAEALHDL